MKVAYLGLPGSNSYIASLKHFKNSKIIGYPTFSDIVTSVTLQKVDYGILPLENSQTGSIYEPYDLLLNKQIYIVGEIYLRIHHCLLAQKESKFKISQITKCFSHQQVFIQCRNFLAKHKNIRPIYMEDTATSAQKLSTDRDLYTSAIASKVCASLYNLKILAHNIEDSSHNYTRFILISNQGKKSGNKASLVFSLKHVSGSLLKALTPYRRLGLNLTKIESRPVVNRPWEYIFFVDFELPNYKDLLPKLLKRMEKNVIYLKLLGHYNKGQIYEA